MDHHFLNSILFIISIFLITVGIVALANGKRKYSNIYLGVFFSIMGLIVFFRFLEISRYMLKVPFLMDIDFTLAFLMLPSYYFFVNSFLYGKKPSITEILMHSTPAFFAFLFLSPVYFYSASEKLNYILHDSISSTSHYYRILNPSFFLQSICYLIPILIITFNRKIQDSREQANNTKWIQILTLAMIALQLSALAFQYLVSGERKFKYFPLVGFFLLLLLLIWLLYESKLLKNEFINQHNNSKAKYQNSNLTEFDLEEIANQISTLISQKEMFLDKNLSLAKLSKEINLPVRTLSEVINRHYACSFNEMINRMRIEYSKSLLLEISDTITIDGIGENSGFSSRASYYSNFKKITNLTPLEFVKKSR